MEPLSSNPSVPTQLGVAAGDLPAEGDVGRLGLAELRTELQLQANQLSLREAQELLGPVRERYPDLGLMPLAELRALVARLALRLRGRGPCDFFQRYRTGRFLALPPLSAEVWSLLPHAERLRLLEADNCALDIAQAARHLAKFCLSPDYSGLADAGAQRDLVISSRYRAVMRRLLALRVQGDVPGVFILNRRVTELALEMEESPRETRGPRLQAIRRTIDAALGLPAADHA